MELTDKVILLTPFIDGATGNKYQARTEPYLYGELPKQIRDNPHFVKPVGQVVITEKKVVEQTSPFARGNEVRLDAQPQPKDIDITPKIVKTEVKEIEKVEEIKSEVEAAEAKTTEVAVDKPVDIIPTEKKISDAPGASLSKEEEPKPATSEKKIRKQAPAK